MSQGFWAVADQALFALSNFAANVLLARWLSMAEYGAFGVAFSVLLLMGTVHTALLAEPMLVLGPGRFQEGTSDYLRRLTRLHFIMTSVMGAALLVAVLVLARLASPFQSGPTLVALAAATPGILFLWLMRRACYLESRPRLAVVAGSLYSLLVLSGMLVLVQAGWLSPASAVVVLGTASFVVAWWLRAKLSQFADTARAPLSSAAVTTAHWRYGRWALASGILGWVPANLVLLVLPVWYSLDQVAELRVGLTLIMPMLQIVAALSILLVPSLVRARRAGNLRAVARTAAIMFFLLSLTYLPAVVALGSEAARWIFGAQYDLSGLTLWLLAVIPVLTAVLGVSSSVLRALERPDWVMWANVAASAVTCVVGLPLVFRWGVDGALGSTLLSLATTVLITVWAGRRILSAARRVRPPQGLQNSVPE